MKLELESTDNLVDVAGVSTRVWTGKTEDGIPVLAFVALVAVQNIVSQRAFLEALGPSKPQAGLQGVDQFCRGWWVGLSREGE